MSQTQTITETVPIKNNHDSDNLRVCTSPGPPGDPFPGSSTMTSFEPNKPDHKHEDPFPNSSRLTSFEHKKHNKKRAKLARWFCCCGGPRN